MKEIKLKKLVLQNWRAQNTVVDFSDHTTEISGKNQSGKSTIYNAFLWLMTGCDEYDRMNFRLFDDTIEHTKETDAPASVVAILSIDGIEYKLERKASMGWTRKRGKAEWERKGSDNYTFAIDDIERSSSEYKKFIEEMILPIDKLKICINIGYLLSLDWKECRKRFEDMVGEINIEDYKGDYSDIWDDLQKYGVEDLKTRYRNIIKRLGKEVEDLPVAIETLVSNLPDLKVIEEAEKDLGSKRKELDNISGSVSVKDDMRKKLEDAENEFNKGKNEYLMDCSKVLTGMREELIRLKKENKDREYRNRNKENAINKLSIRIDNTSKRMDYLLERKKELLAKCKEIKAMEFNEYKCPYCGQELPDDMLEKAKKEFYSNRESKYQDVVSSGKNVASMIDDIAKSIESYKKEIEDLSQMEELNDTSLLEERICGYKDNMIQYEETIEGKEKLVKLANIRSEYETCDGDSVSDKRGKLVNEIESLSRIAGKRDEYDRINARISEMRKKLRDEANEKVHVEGMLEKLSMFEREKASIISEKVNKEFDYISVKMTEVNKSGEIVDTCAILDKDGVSYQVTNSASRMRCGIDVAMCFSRFYGVSLPLFVDNSERMDSSNLPEYDGQVVLLRVSDNKGLNIKYL